LFIVMPDADDVWYTNSATVPLDRFEDYIAKDLISEIDEKCMTIRERTGHSRIIDGRIWSGEARIEVSAAFRVYRHSEWGL
jgi:hypothetical protein